MIYYKYIESKVLFTQKEVHIVFGACKVEFRLMQKLKLPVQFLLNLGRCEKAICLLKVELKQLAQMLPIFWKVALKQLKFPTLQQLG